MKILFFSVILLLLNVNHSFAKTMHLKYRGYDLWMDCEKKAAYKFSYIAKKDRGNERRSANFTLDPNLDHTCQQSSAKTYGSTYDRGHLVPANHLDGDKEAIEQSNYMTNILPQHKNMNRGAWLETEEITECYRDIEDLEVKGGVIWNKESKDEFLHTHGILTPSFYWKIIIRGDKGKERVNAWIIPNSKEAKRKNLDSYLATPKEIEKLTGEKFDIPSYLKEEKPSSSWIIPIGCNKS